ncbi:hypothetical protein [Azospirillum thermophilum]|uniref:Uncharacterized protein n=1 Tax=Azospirillum thermophilum TaxID=2202148 RepID=A0A2S2D0Q6_9PROT|nr:hypothetical protein [Azospirillum thermophilum]AWK90047.1 hypothetical protein DEW08_29095 [Azospirillum thermophilum]
MLTAATEARREAGLEIRALAEEFEQSDEAAFRRSRALCWALVAVVALVELVLWMAGADARYLVVAWLVITALTWGAYLWSSRRQRQQTARLRALAERWLTEPPAGPAL